MVVLLGCLLPGFSLGSCCSGSMSLSWSSEDDDDEEEEEEEESSSDDISGSSSLSVDSGVNDLCLVLL
jgi:hypothetical protein